MALKYFGAGGSRGGAQPVVTCLSTDTKPSAAMADVVGLCVELDTGTVFAWQAGAWQAMSTGGGGAASWGDIQGTLGDQADLQTALDGKSNTGHTHSYEPFGAVATHEAANDPHVQYQRESERGAANGYASLGADGLVPAGQLPAASGGGLGYALLVQALTSSPVDAQTVYFGALPKAPVTTAGISRVYIPKTGTLKAARIWCYSGTAGTGEAWSLYVRLNNTTDTLIAALSVTTNARDFSNTSLSVPVVAGDYLEIKSVQPTWVTNPLTTIYGGHIYIE